MKKIFTVLFILLFAVSFNEASFGFGDRFHELITAQAINRSTQLYNNRVDYLKTELGFIEGLETEFRGPDQWIAGIPYTNTRTAYEWIVHGSFLEDHPMGVRARTHFYDPVNERGLTDIWNWLQTEDHALSRARGVADDGTDLEIAFDYSFADARDYYYEALTMLTNDQRSEYFARTFRALGQVLHLLEDMGVPAHVRNDNHAPVIGGRDPYEQFWKPPPGIGLPSIFDYPVSFNQFDHYWDGDNGKGLAEFTNRNYLSKNTIFRPATDTLHYYANPLKSACELYDIDENPAVGDLRHYWRYKEGRDEYANQDFTVDRLVAASYLGINPDGTPNYGIGDLVDSPNILCHREYGQKLIPYTVGYCAGLLNYFFRGEMNVNYDSTSGVLTVENTSVAPMEGRFEVYWDDEQGGRHGPVVSWNDNVDVGRKTQSPAFFFLPGATKRITVFRGIIGNEEAVAGKIFSALTLIYYPIDICNVLSSLPNNSYQGNWAASHHDTWGTRYGYIKFNISALPSNIASAKLKSYCNETEWNGPTIVGLYSVADTTWYGSTMTWNNKPTMGGQIDSDYGPVGTWYEWDVTSVIRTGLWSMGIKPLSGHGYASHFKDWLNPSKPTHIEVVFEN